MPGAAWTGPGSSCSARTGCCRRASYRARFRLKGAGSRADLQVTTRGGRAILGRAGIHLADGAFVEVPVPFTLTAPAQIEYRARWDGQGWVAVDSVTAAFAAEPDPASLFEVEVLSHELQERPDPNASGGVGRLRDARAHRPRRRLDRSRSAAIRPAATSSGSG